MRTQPELVAAIIACAMAVGFSSGPATGQSDDDKSGAETTQIPTGVPDDARTAIETCLEEKFPEALRESEIARSTCDPERLIPSRDGGAGGGGSGGWGGG